MSTNALILAEARSRVKSKFPTGADNQSATQLSVLVNAVDILQEALAPFAKIASAEIAAGVNGGASPLVHCRLSDCATALKLLKSMEPPHRQSENFGIPAE